MLFSGNSYAVPPQPDELEVSLIGPGYGEAMLVHLGDARWLLIDSCVTPGNPQPAPLEYLRDLGVSLDNVFAVAATHWDEDHIKGLADVVRSCPQADFIMSGAFGREEFVAYATAYDSPLTTKVRSGVKEMREVVRHLADTKRKCRSAGASKRLYGPADLSFTHASPVEVWTFSPSDDEYDNFLAWVAAQMPQVRETRRVSVPRLSNDLSTVVFISVGEDAMLFGGDLEEEGKAGTGWSAILGLAGRPGARASFFKVAHHGSETGEHSGIWSDLLTADPVAALAPWRLGRGILPKPSDVQRILGYTADAFTTALRSSLAPRPRPKAVERTIREAARTLIALPQTPGMLRFRKQAGVTDIRWSTEMFGGAAHLSSY